MSVFLVIFIKSFVALRFNFKNEIVYNKKMIKAKIKQDQIQALKAGDRTKLNILRYILAKIQNQEISKQKELTDEQTIEVLQKQVKEIKETLEAAEKAGRPEMVNQSKTELEIVSAYLPKQLSDEELKKEIKKIIAGNQALCQKNPKAIIGLCVKQLKFKAETSRIITVINLLTK